MTLTDACNLHFSHVPLQLRNYARQRLVLSWVRDANADGRMTYEEGFAFMAKNEDTLPAIKRYQERMAHVWEKIPLMEENEEHGDIVWLHDDEGDGGGTFSKL